jgi:proteasome lid subunit RPN8/RPN11
MLKRKRSSSSSTRSLSKSKTSSRSRSKTSSRSSSRSRSKTSSRSSSRSRSKTSSRSSSRLRPKLISSDELEIIYADKLEGLDYEVCGFLKRNRIDNYLELDEQKNITTDLSRKNCQLKKIKRMIYHTHPLTSKSYPSVEDVLKIVKLKNKIIKVSIIFTRWGIWELHCDNKSDNIPTQIVDKIRKQLTNIYHNQNKGRDELRSKSLLQKSINNINDILSEYDFKMYFSEWDFENDYVLQASS